MSFDIPSLSINLADAFELFESSKQASKCSRRVLLRAHDHICLSNRKWQFVAVLLQRANCSAESSHHRLQPQPDHIRAGVFVLCGQAEKLRLGCCSRQCCRSRPSRQRRCTARLLCTSRLLCCLTSGLRRFQVSTRTKGQWRHSHASIASLTNTIN